MPSTRSNPTAAADATLQYVEKQCGAKGLRLTQTRRKVLLLILQNDKPIKAYDLLTKMHTRFVTVKPPTVYRALDFLLEHGFIHKIGSQSAYVSCQHPDHDQRLSCVLLYCHRCGNMEDCYDEKVVQALSRVTKEAGFQASATSLEVQGTCSACT